jgi:hypothetical protein
MPELRNQGIQNRKGLVVEDQPSPTFFVDAKTLPYLTFRLIELFLAKRRGEEKIV